MFHDKNNSEKIIENINSLDNNYNDVIVESTANENEYNKNGNIKEKIIQINEIDEFINCNKIEKSPLTNITNLEFEVTEPKLVKTGLFSSNYILYKVKTPSLNLEVSRRYSDFQWLYDELKLKFSYIFIPPIPPKVLIDNNNENLSSKRMKMFTLFLNHLATIQSLKSSMILYDFISIEDIEVFNKKQKDYENMNNKSNLEIENIEGIIKTCYNPIIDKQVLFIKNYISKKDNLLQKIINHYSLIQEENKKMSMLYKTLSEYYNELNIMSKENLDPEPLTNTYNFLYNVNNVISNSHCLQINLIETEFKDNFEYFKLETESFLEELKYYSDTKKDYFLSHNSLVHKKEKLFLLKNKNKWELSKENLNKEFDYNNKSECLTFICEEESKKMHKKLIKLGICSSSIIRDLWVLKKYFSTLFNTNFKGICIRNKDLFADIFNLVKLAN